MTPVSLPDKAIVLSIPQLICVGVSILCEFLRDRPRTRCGEKNGVVSRGIAVQARYVPGIMPPSSHDNGGRCGFI